MDIVLYREYNEMMSHDDFDDEEINEEEETIEDELDDDLSLDDEDDA